MQKDHGWTQRGGAATQDVGRRRVKGFGFIIGLSANHALPTGNEVGSGAMFVQRPAQALPLAA